MKKRLTRLAAILTLTTLTGLGITALGDTVAASPQDSGWGAPDTTDTPVATATDGNSPDATLFDSGWG